METHEFTTKYIFLFKHFLKLKYNYIMLPFPFPPFPLFSLKFITSISLIVTYKTTTGTGNYFLTFFDSAFVPALSFASDNLS